MRTILGYIEGRAVWSENQPSSAQPANWFHGSLVQGAPGPAENERARKRVRDREAANAAQRAYYARKKVSA